MWSTNAEVDHEYAKWLLPESTLANFPNEAMRLKAEHDYVAQYLDLLKNSPRLTGEALKAQGDEMQRYVDMLLADPGGPTVSVGKLLGSDAKLRQFFEYPYMGCKKAV